MFQCLAVLSLSSSGLSECCFAGFGGECIREQNWYNILKRRTQNYAILLYFCFIVYVLCFKIISVVYRYFQNSEFQSHGFFHVFDSKFFFLLTANSVQVDYFPV